MLRCRSHTLDTPKLCLTQPPMGFSIPDKGGLQTRRKLEGVSVPLPSKRPWCFKSKSKRGSSDFIRPHVVFLSSEPCWGPSHGSDTPYARPQHPSPVSSHVPHPLRQPDRVSGRSSPRWEAAFRGVQGAGASGGKERGLAPCPQGSLPP